MIRRERARRSGFSLNPLIPRKTLLALHLTFSLHLVAGAGACVCDSSVCVCVLREGLRRRGRAAAPRETPFTAYQHGVPACSVALTGSGDGSATCSAVAAAAAAAGSECWAAAVLNSRLICLSWSREEPAEEKFDEVLTLTPAVFFFFFFPELQLLLAGIRVLGFVDSRPQHSQLSEYVSWGKIE